MLKFGLIGKGKISERHIQAIERIGGEIVCIYDPFLSNLNDVKHLFLYDFDYTVICSPSEFHYEHIKLSLKNNRKLIVEKPAFLPWQPIIDDDRINIVLQYRYLDLPPAEIVKVKMVRDEKYLNSYKADSKLTGGLFYHLLIHYIDLAIELGSNFEGMISTEGNQERLVDNIDLTKINMNDLYLKMYEEIIFKDNGIKPKDIMYLHWFLEKHSDIYGYGLDMINKLVKIKNKF